VWRVRPPEVRRQPLQMLEGRAVQAMMWEVQHLGGLVSVARVAERP
jgi:hypothetical protein